MTRHVLWLSMVVCVGCSDLLVEFPSVGHCMETTTLICRTKSNSAMSNTSSWVKFSGSDFEFVSVNARVINASYALRYRAYKKDNKYFLEINNTKKEDKGTYVCNDGFNQSDPAELKFECKARTIKVAGQPDWKLVITTDDIYPENPKFAVTTVLNGQLSQHVGTVTSTLNQTGEKLYSVSWISSNSLNAVGDYRYNVTVTTITASRPFTGTITFVRPSKPVIQNSVSLADRMVLHGVENQSLRIVCKSNGGYPKTEMAWLKGNANTMFGHSQGKIQSDQTYTVTLTDTVYPTHVDDLVKFTCKSFYRVDGDIPLTNFAILYLKLKPKNLSVHQIGTVSAGNIAKIKCETSKARPAANISWEYRDGISRPNSTIIENETTETFSTISFLRFSVQREDNGGTVKCIVSHEILSPSLAVQTTVSVQFPPLNVSLTADKQVIANGSNILTLKCVTDSANPVAYVQWNVPDNTTITSMLQRNTSGSNAGRVTTGLLYLKPTRHNDGDEIWCLASNSINAEIAVKEKLALDLLYSPEVIIYEQSSKLVNESDTNVAFSCSAHSKPLSNFTWYHNGNALPKNKIYQRENYSSYTIQLVDRKDYGNYSCKASNQISPDGEKSFSLHVQFGPHSVSITGNYAIVADGIKLLTLVCKSDSSNPAAKLIWRNETNQLHSTSGNTSVGLHGGQISYTTLSIKPTRYMNNAKIFCEGSNQLIGNNVVQNSTILNIWYHPVTKALEGPELTVTEGQPSVSLTCVADSNPVSRMIKWYENTSGNIIEALNSSNQLTHTFTVVKREHAGDYTCVADNGINPSESENGQVKLIVQYLPSVTVTTINTTIHSLNVEITCIATGVPSNCTFSKWKHLWPGTSKSIRDELPYNRTTTPSKQIVNVTSLSYQDTGIYTCGARNGVRLWGTNIEEMQNTVYLLVQSYPIITSEEHGRGTLKITPRLNEPFAVNVSFYSNAEKLEAFLYRHINSSVDNNETQTLVKNASLHINDAEVELTVYGQNVRTPGYLLILNHTFYSSSEYGRYSLKIRNVLGTQDVIFITVPESGPCTPVSPAIEAVMETAITVSWIRCYHGGFAQLFVIQYSESDFSWINGTFKEGGISQSNKRINSTIPSLKPATTYYIRMFAYNKIDRSDFSATLNTTTKSKPEAPTASPNVGLIAGGAAGGVVLAAIIVALVLLFLRRRKDHIKGSGKNSLKETDRSACPKGADDTSEINLNPMYEPAGPLPSSSNNSDVYSQVNKNIKKTGPVPDIYSKVDKPKIQLQHGGSKAKTDVYAQVLKKTPKGNKAAGETKHKKQKPDKKTKKGKQIEGMLYDNVDTINPTLTVGDTVYENPSCSLEDEHPKQMGNQDGLIYADLDLPQEPVGKNRKAVIHGLDERTDYADIRFGEVGEDAPESDEENVNKNN